MADTAVRVDIIAGKNTVVSSVDLTKDKLTQLAGVSARTNAGFENLSRSGLKKVEGGMTSLAFAATGVPGPFGKIAQGALLLGGGSGVLLGVAVAAGAVAVAYQYMTKQSDMLVAAINRAKKEMGKQDGVISTLKEFEAEIGRIQALQLVANSSLFNRLIAGTQGWTRAWREQLEVLQQVRAEYGSFGAHGATDDWLTKFWSTHPMPKAGPKAKKVQQPDPAQDWWLNQDFTQQSVVLELKKQMADLNAEMVKTPEIMAQVGLALDNLQFDEATNNFLTTLELTKEFVNAMNQALLAGIMNLGSALASALAGEDSFGNVIKAALGLMMQDIGRLLIQFGVQLTILKPLLSNLLLSGPAMIAAGILISAAGAAVSKRAQGQSVSGSAARGGVNSGNLSRDAGEIAARGTVTIQMGRDGFIRPSDPVFQEFLAQVIKEAKGRNVVFA